MPNKNSNDATTSLLIDAAEAGDLESIEGLLIKTAAGKANVEVVNQQQKKGKKPDGEEFGGDTPLNVAVGEGHLECVRCLVEKGGADVNYADGEGGVPLLVACVSGHLECVRYLVEKGADVNYYIDGGKTTPLYTAANMIFSTPEARKDKGRVEIIRVLLENGAEASYPFLLAVKDYDVELCRILLDNGVDANGVVVVDELCDFSPLGFACMSTPGSIEIVSLLLKRGADANAYMLYDGGKVLPLHSAIIRASKEEASQRTIGIEHCRALLDHGADANGVYVGKDNKKYTPLGRACDRISSESSICPIETIQLLLKHGAQVDATFGSSGLTQTPLFCALLPPNIELCRLLIDNGADVNKTCLDMTNRGQRSIYNPLSWIICSLEEDVCDIMELLLKSGADPNATFLHKSTDVNDTVTPVIYAILWNKPKNLSILLKNGAKANTCDKKGLTPLHWAAYSDNAECILILLEHKADIEFPTKGGNSPLWVAKNKGCHQAVHVLLKNGAKDVDVSTAGDGSGLLQEMNRSADKWLSKLAVRALDEIVVPAATAACCVVS